MFRTFVQSTSFSKKWDELGFSDEDLIRLESEIMKNPDKYPVMKGTGGLRKIRISFQNRGKSGSARACFVDFVVAETVYLVAIYSKNEKENLTKSERNEVRKLIEILRKELEKSS